MGNNKIIPILICLFAINHFGNVIVIKRLQKSIVGLAMASNSLMVISDQVSSSPLGTEKGLVIALATRLPNDCKKMVILTFQMGKLSQSNFGKVVTLSAMCM